MYSDVASSIQDITYNYVRILLPCIIQERTGLRRASLAKRPWCSPNDSPRSRSSDVNLVYAIALYIKRTSERTCHDHVQPARPSATRLQAEQAQAQVTARASPRRQVRWGQGVVVRDGGGAVAS